MDCGCVMYERLPADDFYSLNLHNNIFAKDVSSVELMAFLEQDSTNEHEIVEYLAPPDRTLEELVSSGYQCANFAVALHNNAEQAGIRCAVVECNEIAHAFDAFNTTDKGLVYVDASSGFDHIIVPVKGYSLTQHCKVREGVGTMFIMELGNPETYKITW